MSEVFGEVGYNGRQYELTSENMMLYTHIGQAAVFNHVFAALFENGGTYLWADNPYYEAAAEFVQEHDGIQVLNLRAVSEVDEQVYYIDHTRDTDYLPEGWE